MMVIEASGSSGSTSHTSNSCVIGRHEKSDLKSKICQFFYDVYNNELSLGKGFFKCLGVPQKEPNTPAKSEQKYVIRQKDVLAAAGLALVLAPLVAALLLGALVTQAFMKVMTILGVFSCSFTTGHLIPGAFSPK